MCVRSEGEWAFDAHQLKSHYCISRWSRCAYLFPSLQMDHWGWKSIRREEETTVEIEFFDGGSLPLPSLSIMSRDRGQSMLCLRRLLEIELDKWFFFSVCAFRTMLIFFHDNHFSLPLVRSIVRHSVEFCCPWRINKRWVCACRSDLSMCVCLCATTVSLRDDPLNGSRWHEERESIDRKNKRSSIEINN